MSAQTDRIKALMFAVVFPPSDEAVPPKVYDNEPTLGSIIVRPLNEPTQALHRWQLQREANRLKREAK